MENVMGYKLLTGEDVVGEVVEDNFNSVSLKNSILIVMMPEQNTGRVSIEFAPFPMLAEKQKDCISTVNKSAIAYPFSPNSVIMEKYNKIFGSGIILPSKQLIKG